MSHFSQDAIIPRLSPWRARCIAAIAAELFDLSGNRRPVETVAEDFIEDAIDADLDTADEMWRAVALTIRRAALLADDDGQHEVHTH